MKKDMGIKIGVTFYLCSILGYFYELILNYFYKGNFYSHGFLKGPWLPIYGIGALLLLIINKYKKKPLVIFLLSFFLTGLLEGLSGFLLLKLGGIRLWNYKGYFLNINGYVCLLSAFCFGIGGLIFTYLLNPLIEKIIAKVNNKLIIFVLTILSLIFTGDIIATIIK